MDGELYGALDVGTTSCKFIIVSGEGEVVASSFSEYQTNYPRPGWAEQEPTDWIEAVKRCLGTVEKETLLKIAGLSVDAPAHTLVFLDENDKPLRPSLIWEDQRASQESETIRNEDGDRIRSISNNDVKPIFGLPQLKWVMTNDGEAWKKTARLTFIKDFVRGFLTGSFGYTDYADPIGTLFFDVNKRDWSDSLCNKYGIGKEKLPEPRQANALGGEVSLKASNDTMLPKGTPVKIGTIDVSADHLASGVVEVGDIMIKVSTVGVLSAIVDKPLQRTVNYTIPIEERWLSKSNTLYAGASYRWVKRLFSETSYESMDSRAAQSPEGSNGLLFHPYLGGEASPYWLSQLQGAFHGVLSTTSQSDVFRAVLEGVAFSLRDSLSEFGDTSINHGTIVGGAAKSDLWCHIMADILQVEVSRVRHTDAAYGCAMIAASEAGSLADVVKRWGTVEKSFLPRKKTVYEEKFEEYRRIASFLAASAK